MNFLKKIQTEIWVIKLFKLTDQNSAEKFDMESKVLFCNNLIEERTELKSENFDINYQSSYKTKKGFEKALKSKKEIVICIVDFNSDKTDTYFSIDNQMLNLTEKPKKSTIDFCLQIKAEFVNEKTILELNKNLITELDFDYGYTTKLTSDFDAGTERKIKKGLFSTSVKILDKDFKWSSEKTNILNGAIKNLYPINYLNESHFTSPEKKKIISEFGELEKINDKIYKWNISNSEIEKLKNTKRIELNLTE